MTGMYNVTMSSSIELTVLCQNWTPHEPVVPVPVPLVAAAAVA